MSKLGTNKESTIMNKKVKLAIAIPTYNRCESLKENISQLLMQLKDIEEDIIIIVSDNASTDNTPIIMNKLQRLYPEIIFYYRQKENLGYIINFKLVISYSNAEYIYLMGDDDILFPNSIITFLMFIKKYPNISFFHFNYVLGNSSMNTFKLKYTEWEQVPNTVLYDKGYKLIEQFFNGPSFMSSILFKKEIFKNYEIYIGKYYGYEWLMCLYHNILNQPCIFSPIPIVAQRTGENGYSKNWAQYSIVGMSMIYEELEKEVPGIYHKWNKFQKKNKYDLLLSICAICYDRKRYIKERKMLMYYLPNQLYKLFLLVNLYCFPIWFILKIEYKFILLIKKIEKEIRKTYHK